MWDILRWWIFACVKQLMLWIPFMNRSFVILSSGRSGSTLLIQLLNCHPKITCKASLIPSRMFLPYTGFKLFNEQLEFCNLHLKDLLTALFYPRVVILYRESMLETYVSLEIAFKTDVWYSEGSGTGERIEIDWQKFVDYAMTEKVRWKRSMAEISMYSEVLFVSYEELMGNRENTMNRVFQFLNLDMCHVEAASKKQNPLPIREKIINYEHIEQKMLQSEDSSYTVTKDWLEMIRVHTTGRKKF